MRDLLRTLKGKISLVYIGLVLVTAVIGIVSIFNISNMQKMIDSLMTANYKSISVLSKMQEAIERQDSAELIYITTDKDKGISIFTENGRAFLENYTVENGNITESGEKVLVEEVNAQYSRYTGMFSMLQETGNASGKDAAVNYYNSEITPIFNNIKSRLRDLVTLNENAMFKSKSTAVQNAQNSMYLLIGICTVAVMAGLFMARFFANRFLSPLYQLARGIGTVGEGKLGQKIEIKSKDETAHLAREFNKMTERLQQYEQSALGTLLNEKNKSVAIVKSIADPIIVLDNDFKVMLINTACETYFSVEEANIKGKHLLQAIRNDKLFDLVTDAINANDPGKERTLYLPYEDGSYFSVIVTPFPTGSEKPEGFIVLLQNITGLKKLEKIKTEFVATVSHEFKTPLTSILMGASLLSEKGTGNLTEEQSEIVETIKEDGERLSTLVTDMLELSRIESGKAVYHQRPCSITAIIDGCFKQFISYAETKHVELINEVDDDLPKVSADFEKVSWVFNNLLSNALKYTDAGDSITISARQMKDKVQVQVADTGMGIPPEYIDKLFDRYSLARSQDIEARGTGLGLSVVKEIITAHHGEIYVTSELDAGSTFTFTLPISGKEEQT